ncbi:CYTH and CHAD domain-containing protein [Pedococcus bigeumensis]|uniref:CYTH and CHAD domain-containing protein n=1 Tax=Pedococcus bigeumensis TaxID=433644 RepID=UPI002FE77212
MGTRKHLETERKYQVDVTTVTPFSGEALDPRVDEVAQAQLEAVYFDTAELDLHRRGITLRRRTGGDDEGWHVKIPRGPDQKTEIQQPLGRAVKAVPRKVLDQVRAIVRDRPLVPVATIITDRTTYTLLDHEEPVALLCDDRVTARAMGDDEDDHAWREWELEALDGARPRSVFALFEPALLDAGAHRAHYGSKLGHVLARLDQEPAPVRQKRPRKGDAGELLRQRLEQQITALHAHDAAVRDGSADGIHRMRIAARRLRSALTTTKPLLTTPQDELREELRWLGQTLSPARDALVIRERLETALEAEPREVVLGPVRSRLRLELTQQHKQALAAAKEALDSPRYFALLDALDTLAADLPLAPSAKTKARKVMGDLVRRDTKKLHQAVKAAKRSDPAARDQALHEARKKAKRLRYAAELAAPAGGRRAPKLASRAKAVQQALGQHQDSVVARQHLRQLGAQAFLHSENGFTFGLLHGAERLRAQQAERDFQRALDRLPRPRAAGSWAAKR